MGCAQVGYICGGRNYFSFDFQEEIERFKVTFQKNFQDHCWCYEPGQNTLQEFRDGKFIVTDLETMTTKEYNAEDYFREVVVTTEE